MSVRIYLPNAQTGKELKLSKEDTRHLRVLRLKEGEEIRAFDGKGHEYSGVYSAKVRHGTLTLDREITPRKELLCHITLATAIPKGSRMDFLIEKVTELGATHIIPTTFKRSVVLPGENKIERWKRITIEACSQSERSIIPTVQKLTTLNDVLAQTKLYDHAFICHPEGTPLIEQPTGKHVLIIVGPEGDFTPEELALAEKAGCQKVSLAPTILRVETAGIAAISQISGKKHL